MEEPNSKEDRQQAVEDEDTEGTLTNMRSILTGRRRKELQEGNRTSNRGSGHRPISPPPPPPMPSPGRSTKHHDKAGQQEATATEGEVDKDNDKGNSEKIGDGDDLAYPALSIPRHFGGLTSDVSSLNSSFYTFDLDMDDIRNLELVDDDDDTQAASAIVEVGEPLRRPASATPAAVAPQDIISLSPPRSPGMNQQRTPIIKNTGTAAAAVPPNPLMDPTAVTTTARDDPNHPNELEDSFQFATNMAHHLRADVMPVRPQRGTSICSEDSERIKAALAKQQYMSRHMTSSLTTSTSTPSNNSTANNNNSGNLQSSNSSSFPSMWEESWSTFATMDNSNSHHGPAAIIHEGDDEDHDSMDTPPKTAGRAAKKKKSPPPTIHTAATATATTTATTPSPATTTTGPNIANQSITTVFQQMRMQQQSLLGAASNHGKNCNSKNQRPSMTSNTPQAPRRTSSRNSQYSSFSNMSKTSTNLDASQIKRVSRNERISRLKRKSLQPPQQGSVSSHSSSPTQTFSKLSKDSLPSAGSSLSHNSAKPERRPTKVLPHDEEAEAEPRSFFEHSESQLSLTSSEEEDEEYLDESDMTPQLPGRRSSACSASLYEAEAACIRMNMADDQPLSAPLRRTSTWGSVTNNTGSLEPHPETVNEEEEEAEEDDDEEEESIVELVLEEDNSYHLPMTSVHLMEDNSSSDNLPVSSVHLQENQDDSDQNLTMSSVHRGGEIMQVGSDQHLPSSIHLPPPLNANDGQNRDKEQDYGPTLPTRQHSIPRAVITKSQQEWLQHASPATAEDLPRPSASYTDFKPNKPKRQTTLTKEDLYARLLGSAFDDDSADKENSSAHSSSMSFSSHNSDSKGAAAPRRAGHRRTLSNDAPHPPARQVSKTSTTIMSPALLALDGLSFHDSKEFLLLSNEEQDFLQGSLSSHAGDFDFTNKSAPPLSHHPPGNTTQALAPTSTKAGDDQAQQGSTNMAVAESSSTSLAMESHVRSRAELQKSSSTSLALQSSALTAMTLTSAATSTHASTVVSAATTHCASNIAAGRRVLPVRHNTRGSSLRSAAASLQQRGSLSSLISNDAEDNANAAATAGNTASADPGVNLSEEFEALKKLNSECTVQELNDQLDSLQLGCSMSDVVAANPVDNPAVLKNVIGMPKMDDANVESNEENAATTIDQTKAALGLGGSTHSNASIKWTSASKEFEHLKVMYDDTVADLETQLQMLEQQENEQNDSSQFDLSRASLNDSSSFGGDHATRKRNSGPAVA